MCRILNNVLYAKVKTDKYISSEFKVNQGFKYGDAFSPLLFNIVLENAIRRSKVESLGNTFDKYRQIMVTMWLLWEEDYKMLKKYLRHWSKKQVRWEQK
jgi:hypothetical protein